MHLAITPILIYILNRVRRLQVFKPFAERNLFLVFQLRLSVQVRLLSNFYTVRKIQTHPLLFGYAALQFTRREREKNRTGHIYEKHMSKTSQ